VGVLFQAGALFDSMTVRENVSFPMEERRELAPAEIARRVDQVLEEVELGEHADKYPGELSGGMVKRAALARSLVFDPRLLVFDEPTAGLDPLTTQMVIRLLQRARGGGRRRTVLAVVNDLAAAFSLADQLAMLHQGQVVEASAPEAFRASEHPAVQALLRAWKRRDALARER
jgi:phospholipid/cholesterol/gamma-HCH transport system ATP-binding protein